MFQKESGAQLSSPDVSLTHLTTTQLIRPLGLIISCSFLTCRPKVIMASQTATSQSTSLSLSLSSSAPLPLSSSASPPPLTAAQKAVKRAEIDQSIQQWVEEAREDRPKAVRSVQKFFGDPKYSDHVGLIDKSQLTTVMHKVLFGQFKRGANSLQDRLDGIRDVLREWEADGDLNNPAHQSDVESDGVQLEEDRADPESSEEQKDEDHVNVPASPAPSPPPSGRSKSVRKAKSQAQLKIREVADGTSSVLQKFASNVNAMGHKSGKRSSAPKKPSKPASARKIAFESSGDDPDSSSSDSSSSSSSSDSSSSSSSDSDSDSPSDSEAVSPARHRVKRIKRKSSSNSIKREKKKEGYKHAKQIWSMSGGRVHHFLNQYEWSSKRSEYEMDTITRVFDHRMRHGANLWDKDIRLLASRIMVLQTHDLTGSWETAAQFQDKPMGYVVLKKKQLSRAARNAEQLQKVAPNKNKSNKPLEQQHSSSASDPPSGFRPAPNRKWGGGQRSANQQRNNHNHPPPNASGSNQDASGAAGASGGPAHG